MFSAGHGTWHCQYHSFRLSHVSGPKYSELQWHGHNCRLAGHPQRRVPGPGRPGSCQARQEILLDILKEGSGLEHSCFLLDEGCLWLPEGSFDPKETAALLADDQAPPKYGRAREGYKIWILAAHAGRNDGAVAG